jgi:hypothetical protein
MRRGRISIEFEDDESQTETESPSEHIQLLPSVVGDDQSFKGISKGKKSPLADSEDEEEDEC